MGRSIARGKLTVAQLSCVGIVVVAATMGFQVHQFSQDKQHQVQLTTTTAQSYSAQRNVLASDVKALRSQVEYCKAHPKDKTYCAKPVAPDPAVRIKEVPGPQGAPGPQGLPGRAPTQTEVAAAVNAYMAAHPVHDGRPPTQAEIATAVTAYLEKNPPPSGPPGAQGDKGDKGEAGDTGPRGEAGAQGPPPSQEDVAAAVSKYFDDHEFTCTPNEDQTIWTCQVKT